MTKVEIYTWRFCPYCLRAKELLRSKGISFVEYSIDGDNAARERMVTRAEGRRTLPQIFINEQGIGGCDELYALDQKQKLDILLEELN